MRGNVKSKAPTKGPVRKSFAKKSLKEKKSFPKKTLAAKQEDSADKYVVYCDGSWRPPRCGAWAAVVLQNDKVLHELRDYQFDVTVNRMELEGMIQGIEKVPQGSQITIFCDSQYAVNAVNQWIHGWARNDWITRTYEPVRNRDLMEKLLHLKSLYRISAIWIRGHSGNKWNEHCDTLAQELTRKMQSGEISR